MVKKLNKLKVCLLCGFVDCFVSDICVIDVMLVKICGVYE